MNILAIEASGSFCSIALNYQEKIYQQAIEAPQKQGEFILPMVQEALSAMAISFQSLDNIAFNAGPGSFTGLRLTAAVAQGLSVGWQIPLIPVCSLQALAYKFFQETAKSPVAVSIDARKQEIYVAAYEFSTNSMKILVPEQVIAPEKLVCSVPVEGPLAVPSALDILHFTRYLQHLGHKPIQPHELELIYLRNKVTD